MEESEDEVQTQQTVLEKLKLLRTRMIEKISEATEITEYRKLKAALQEVEKKYANERFIDARQYSTTTQAWKEGFINFLKKRENHDPKRRCNMAMDVILPYEQSQ